MTTVGYGDVYPITAAGRLVGAFTMIVGISTFAIVTAKIAAAADSRGENVAAAAGDPTLGTAVAP